MTAARSPSRRAGWSVRTNIVLIVLAAVLPLLVLAGLLAQGYVAAETKRFERGVRDAVFDASLVLERDLTGTTAALQALATSPFLGAGDLAAFHAQASQVRDLLGGNLVLRDAGGRQVMSTFQPWGAPLPEGSALTRWDPEVLATGRPLVTGLYRGITDGEHRYAVVVPVRRDGAIAYLLHVTLPAMRLLDVVGGLRMPDGAGGVISLVDQHYTVLLRQPGREGAVGSRATLAAQLEANPAAEIAGSAVARDGREMFYVHRRLGASGWFASVAVPVEVVMAPLRRTLWTAAGVAAGLVALALTGAAILGHRLSEAICDLVRLGEALGRDAPVSPPDGPVREVNAVGAALADAAARHAMMVHELNHRVRNTLATVDSLARLSARHATSVADHEVRLSERIRGLGKTHVLLTESNWTEAGLETVLRNELAAHDSGDPGRVSLDGPPVSLPARHVLAMGMLVHELATNAAKHGALSRPEGRVEVRWTVRRGADDGTDPPRLDLVWRESGGPPVTPPARNGFGTQLIERGLSRDLGAKVRADYEPGGLRFSVSMPLVMPAPGETVLSALQPAGRQPAVPEPAAS